MLRWTKLGDIQAVEGFWVKIGKRSAVNHFKIALTELFRREITGNVAMGNMFNSDIAEFYPGILLCFQVK